MLNIMISGAVLCVVGTMFLDFGVNYTSITLIYLGLLVIFIGPIYND